MLMDKEYRPGLISVVMPCFNAERFIEEAVASVMNQSYENVELIVVDDGSTDDSKDILKNLVDNYSDRMIVLSQKNKGPYPARNFGLRHANGEFVAFLDADDYWSVDCLEELHVALSGSDAVLAYCGWQNVGLSDKRSQPYIPPDFESGNKLEYFLRASAPWPIHAALVGRRDLDHVGVFDEHWPTCMDYDLWLRIGIMRPIVRVPKVLAFYRHHNRGQITSTQWRQAITVWRIKKNFLKKHQYIRARFSTERLRELIDGALLRRAYDCYWRRDLVSAQYIFRKVLLTHGYKLKDLKYILPALLPGNWYVAFIRKIDVHSIEK